MVAPRTWLVVSRRGGERTGRAHSSHGSAHCQQPSQTHVAEGEHAGVTLPAAPRPRRRRGCRQWGSSGDAPKHYESAGPADANHVANIPPPGIALHHSPIEHEAAVHGLVHGEAESSKNFGGEFFGEDREASLPGRERGLRADLLTVDREIVVVQVSKGALKGVLGQAAVNLLGDFGRHLEPSRTGTVTGVPPRGRTQNSQAALSTRNAVTCP